MWLFSLIRTALKIWRRRKSCRILRDLGAILFIPLMRMTRATLASAGTQMLFSALAWALSLASCTSESKYSSVYLIVLSSASWRAVARCLRRAASPLTRLFSESATRLLTFELSPEPFSLPLHHPYKMALQPYKNCVLNHLMKASHCCSSVVSLSLNLRASSSFW